MIQCIRMHVCVTRACVYLCVCASMRMQALRVGGPQADTAFTDAQQEATQQGAALAALAQLPGEGVRPADPARLLTVSLTGLKDSVWLLRKAKHAGSITKGLGRLLCIPLFICFV